MLQKIQELRAVYLAQQIQSPDNQRFLSSQNPFATNLLAQTLDNDFFVFNTNRPLDVEIETGTNPDGGSGNAGLSLSLQAGLAGESGEEDRRQRQQA